MIDLLRIWGGDEFKLATSEVDELQKKTPHPLPKTYTRILTEYGRPYFDSGSKYFDVMWSNLDGGTAPSHLEDDLGAELAIFGLSSPDAIERMTDATRRGRRIAGGAVLPDHYFPFAEDHFGAMIVFDLSPERHGQVYAWWPRSDRWGEGENQYIGFVADSLDDFLFNRLRDESTDDFVPAE